MKVEELAADTWADCWMLDKWKQYKTDECVFIGRCMGTALAHAAGCAAFILGLMAAWQILRERRWADRVGLTLTTLIFGAVLLVTALEAYNYVLRYFLIALGDLPLIAVIKGVARYQLPHVLPLFALTLISGFGLAVVYRRRVRVGLLTISPTFGGPSA